MTTKTPFSNFTNLYSLSKTLRFELKPTPETEKLLKKTNLQGKTPIQVDKDIDNLYQKEMKPLFDQLHENFITEALKSIAFETSDLQNLEQYYLELKKLNKDRKNNFDKIKRLNDKNSGKIPQLEKKLREIIVERFNKLGDVWKEKYQNIKLDDKGFKILSNAKILEVLLILYPEKSEFIKKFQGFFMYFDGLNKNRENYYTSEDKATGVANRIINENLMTFLNDRQVFEQILEKIPSLKEYNKFFELENYQYCLIQEDIEKFNEKEIGEINKIKNLFLQQENTKPENKDKNIYLPNLKKLYKQIGCKTKQQKEQVETGESIYPKYLEKIGLGFQITKDTQGKYEVWQALQYINNTYKEKLEKLKKNYQDFFTHWSEYNLNEIWFRKESINTISARWFGGDKWNILTEALKKTGTGKMEKGEYKVPSFVSLWEIKQAMDDLVSYEAENLFREEDKYQKLFKSNLFETFLAIWQYEIDSRFNEIRDSLKVFEEKSKEPFDKTLKDENGKSSHTSIVKNFIEDGYLRLYQMTKYHNLEKKGEKDPRVAEGKFYDALDEFWKDNEIVTYHKAFQATLTKKPYSGDKIKLNFECGTLLGGWASDYESYGALIFKREDVYYLGIIKGTKFNDNEIKTLNKNINDKNKAKRLIYLTQKIDNKNPPRWFIRSKGASFSPMIREGLLNPKDILNIYDNKLYSKTVNKIHYREYLPKLLDYYKEGFIKHKDFKKFTFDWLDSREYETVADFYNHTADMCYKINWEGVNFEALTKLVQQNRLYLFQIYNKDFELDENIGKSKYGETFKADKNIGIKNSHTQIFLELLKTENVKQLKLLGGGELFFRNPSKEKKYKKDKLGKEVLDAKRYYEQKYFLHFPIQIKGKNRNLKNSLLNQIVKDNYDQIKIIGIDRGEKHLLYYSVTDSTGKMIEQGSLNEIQCGDKKVNYNEILSRRAGNMMEARKNWETIGNIKNFKEGYLSQAVYKIYQLILKHNAIVVMEDLNTEFKAKRASKVEKSIYKKFELALARKLNHLILKDKKAHEEGGVLNAYQLTPVIDAGDIGKFEKARQWGILFYVRAHYTSTTDPVTGWRKHKYISNSETEKKIKEFFSPETGIQINYDSEKKCFKFSYQDDRGKPWNLYAFDGMQRFYWNNKDRKMGKFNLYEDFEKLFTGLNKSKNINQQIYNKKLDWKRLVFLWNLLNQIRNTDREKEGDENDFLQSPVWSEKYKCFYDSCKVVENNIPNNGDANGAYNIARKGALLLQRIKNCPEISKFGNDNNGKNPENGYYISDQDWDAAVSDWDKYVSSNSR